MPDFSMENIKVKLESDSDGTYILQYRRQPIMQNFSMENIKVKLDSDSGGTYKKWLLNQLQNYKYQYAHLKQGLLQPDIYEKLYALDRSFDAALTVISQYRCNNSKTPERTEEITLSALFYL
jgi:hypothetical protein